MAREYCMLGDVQARIRAGFEDRDVTNAIQAATTRIEQETERVFEASASETRVFVALRDGFCVVDDLLTASSVEWGGVILDDDLYTWKPGGTRAPKWAVTGPWREGDEVTITGVWGYSVTPPADIKDACIEWVIRSIKAADGGYGDASFIQELGQLVYKKAIPETVRRVLDRYRRVVPV